MFIDVGWVEVEIEIDSLVLIDDVVKRTDSESFFVHLVLFVHNKPISMLIEGVDDVGRIGWELEIEFKFNFLNLVFK